MDKLEFRFYNPQGIEEWADVYDDEAVEIIINKRKLTDIIPKEKYLWLSDCSNMPANKLYWSLSRETDSYTCQYGSYVLCCKDCAEPGCLGLRFFITESDAFFYWKGADKEISDLSFAFEKQAYLYEIEKLKEHAKK